MGEGNQPIIPRDNPLARKLAAIGVLNETYGTRAQGGAGAPIVPDEPGPSAVAGTVLPPDPVPVTPEEEAELQRKFDEQWNPPRGKESGPMQAAITSPRVVPSSIGIPDSLVAIDLKNKHVIANTGDTFPIADEEQKELTRWAFIVMVRSMNQRVAELAKSMGIDQEAQDGPAAVQEVRSTGNSTQPNS